MARTFGSAPAGHRARQGAGRRQARRRLRWRLGFATGRRSVAAPAVPRRAPIARPPSGVRPMEPAAALAPSRGGSPVHVLAAIPAPGVMAQPVAVSVRVDTVVQGLFLVSQVGDLQGPGGRCHPSPIKADGLLSSGAGVGRSAGAGPQQEDVPALCPLPRSVVGPANLDAVAESPAAGIGAAARFAAEAIAKGRRQDRRVDSQVRWCCAYCGCSAGEQQRLRWRGRGA